MDGRVLVTIRDPGLLLLMRPDPSRGLVEEARVDLPPDAWGIAVTPDEKTALVSSAWSNKISAVDLDEARARFSIEVAREPRAIVVLPGGASAYVTHLLGPALTRIDRIDGDAPAIARVDLPPAPASAPMVGHPDAFPLDATLAYSAVLSPGGDRLFVPRHALGAYGRAAWFGRPTVDVLLTADASPLAPARTHAGMIRDEEPYMYPDQAISADGQVPLSIEGAFSQPRAIAYRRSSRTLLVASEGSDAIAELDARSLDPALKAVRSYDLGGPRDKDKPGASRCGAPSGIAVSADELEAYVFCRSTGDLAVVTLDPPGGAPRAKAPDAKEEAIRIVHLADDALPEQAAIGRRLFFDARDSFMSNGLACAGCHPEGREDGHVWHEQHNRWGGGGLTAAPTQDHGIVTFKKGRRAGFPRQTPMLVGRVAAAGPYGWHGEAKTLEQRIMFGFGIHRWDGDPQWIDLVRAVPRAAALAAFLRQGLVPPPKEARALTAEEERGKAIFNAGESMCATCHFPGSDFTDRSVVKLKPVPAPKPFDDEPHRTAFKTPSLLFVGRTAPYYHDGRAATLAELIDQNHDRMGLTDHLPREDRAALVAFLKTIGTVTGEDEGGAGARARPRAVKARAGTLSPEEALLASLLTDSSSFAADPPGEAASPKPTKAEWEGAEEVTLAHQSPLCRVHRARAWVRVRCSEVKGEPLAQVTLIAGPKEGVELAAAKGVAEVIFPVRRGDRRLFEIDRLVEAWKSWVLYDGTVVISEVWLPGAAAPEITVTSEPLADRSILF
jgi:cytochrome c peroxidase